MWVYVCSLRFLCLTEEQIRVGFCFCESVADFVPLFPLFNQIASLYFFHVSSAGSLELQKVQSYKRCKVALR